MSVSGILEIPYLRNSPQAITAELSPASGGVFIELWDENGTPEILASSGCNRFGNTNWYGWPVSGLAALEDPRAFFHWRMAPVSGSTEAQGDVVIYSVEGKDGGMPSLNDKSSYII